MKAGIVSQYYRPESVIIPPLLADFLASRGHSVRVVTGFPNYPDGEIFPGYRQRWRQRESDGNVQICRVPLFIDHSRRARSRIANYVTFALASSSARSFLREADVVYVYASQMTAALGPWMWHVWGGAPYVLHVVDLWPDSITGSSIAPQGLASRIIQKLLNPWLARVYRRAAAIIVPTPTLVETLRARGVASSKLHLVYNWADESGIDPRGQSSHARGRESRRTRVTYAGNVGDMQDLETAIRAAHRLSDEPSFHLSIVGSGVTLESLKRLAATLGLSNVSFHPKVAADQMAAVHRDSDFELVTLKNIPLFRATIPSKFQAALANGVPVITNVDGDLRDLVGQSKIGLVAEPGNVESLAQAFRNAARMTKRERTLMGERARTFYVRNLSFAEASQRIESILLDAHPKPTVRTR